MNLMRSFLIVKVELGGDVRFKLIVLGGWPVS